MPNQSAVVHGRIMRNSVIKICLQIGISHNPPVNNRPFFGTSALCRCLRERIRLLGEVPSLVVFPEQAPASQRQPFAEGLAYHAALWPTPFPNPGSESRSPNVSCHHWMLTTDPATRTPSDGSAHTALHSPDDRHRGISKPIHATHATEYLTDRSTVTLLPEFCCASAVRATNKTERTTFAINL